jgi:hypothetical protein
MHILFDQGTKLDHSTSKEKGSENGVQLQGFHHVHVCIV